MAWWNNIHALNRQCGGGLHWVCVQAFTWDSHFIVAESSFKKWPDRKISLQIYKSNCWLFKHTDWTALLTESDSSHVALCVLDCVSGRSLKCTQYNLTVQDCSNVTCIIKKKETKDRNKTPSSNTNLVPLPAGLCPHRPSLDLDAEKDWRTPPLMEGRGLKGKDKPEQTEWFSI